MVCGRNNILGLGSACCAEAVPYREAAMLTYAAPRPPQHAVREGTATLKPVRVPQRSSRLASQVVALGPPGFGSLAGIRSAGMLPKGFTQCQ
jgi:hypothetical protein